ncbi:MAG: tetratricopeptide repeat protein [Flavobacteriales bacterium]|nr:tetratricopeptide repeat protein [Flavobacteriales bacterium]
MKNIFYLFISVFLIFVGCDKSLKGKDTTAQKDIGNNDSLMLFVKNIDFKSNSNTKIYAYSKLAFDYIYNSNKNDSLTRGVLLKIARTSQKIGKENLFLKANKLLLIQSIEKKDSINIGNSYFLSADNHFEKGTVDSAFFYFLKAEKYFLKKNDNEVLGTIYLKKSLIQLEINDLYGAEFSATESLKYLKLSKDVLGQYDAFTNLGIISNETENYDKAIHYHSKALEIAESYKDQNFYLKEISLNNLGNTYQNSKKYKDAINKFQNALSNNKLSIFKPSLYATLIDNIAYCKFKLNDTRDLPKLFFESLRIRDSLHQDSKVIFSKIHLSEYFHFKGDSLNSNKYAKEALFFSRETKSPLDILASLKQVSIVDTKNSSKHSNEYFKLSDSLQSAERNSKDRFARIQFETDEIIQQNTQLSEQNRDILNYFAIAIVFGGFLFFARFQRLKARELALKQTQQQANEEIYRLIISHQNQLEEGRDLEKKRISKELHDGVLGRLFGLRLNLDGLNNFDDEETKQQRLEYLNELKVIEQDLREISHELSRENLVLINNFVAIINNLLEQQSKINKAKINTLISDKIDWEKVSNTIKINLYRILQESLQNINKHAEASKINVIFNKDPKGNLIFSVEDDGKGYNTNGKKTKGIGMNNIVDRVHQCQGKIDIKSQIGKGTKIIITFPLENETINM